MYMLEAFNHHVQCQGHKVAIDCQEQTLTYQALQNQINQLANYLEQKGVTVGTRVGLCLERGTDAVIGLLALLHLGATYLPLDPTYPAERLAYMLAEVKPFLVLAQEQTLDCLPDTTIATLCLEREQANIQAHSMERSAQRPSGETLAYIMYTSGSTGKPKGVKMPRVNVERYIQAIVEILDLHKEDIYLHTASFSFSSSIRQLLVPLSQGATVVLTTSAQSKNPLALLRLMSAKNVTISDTVASVWRSVLQAVNSLEPATKTELLTNSLRLVLLSGALTTCSVLQRIRQNLKSRPQIINIYGQTETIGVCAYRVPEDFAQTDGYVPVGLPYAHNRAYVLDEARQPVQAGEIGELYVSGGCIFAGYLNRPDLTESVLSTNPWAASEQEQADFCSQLYKTGDVACQTPAGVLEIRGRTDFQVKIRGMRIELGEIESAIEKGLIGKEAIVLAKTNARDELSLVAYIVPQPDVAQLSSKALTRRLKQELEKTLPSNWLPELVVPLTALPLTPNGKRDRLQLPAPDWSALSSESDGVSQSNTETQLVQIWSELFGFKPGLKDNFFDLGGNSLMAVQLFAKLERSFGKKLSLNHLLEHPTIPTLGTYLESEHHQEESIILVPLRKGESQAPPLFCIHAVGGGVMFYRRLLPYLSLEQTVYGVQSRGFDGVEEPLNTVSEMAQLYLQSIRQIYPEGPIYLVGHSFGGFVAYEMAQQLHQQGEEPGLLILLDVKTPKLVKSRLSKRQLIKTVTWNLWQLPNSQKLKYIRKSIKWFYRKRKTKQDRKYAEELRVQNPDIRMFNVLGPNYQAQESYQPKSYSGDLVLCRASIQSPRSAKNRALGWDELVDGAIRIHTIPGQHLTILDEPNVQELGKVLRLYLGEPAKLMEIAFL
ncbi:MAG: amino acid adenylation domain-containing protein [Cyanobacteria bacterium P01_G01_bin.54]